MGFDFEYIEKFKHSEYIGRLKKELKRNRLIMYWLIAIIGACLAALLGIYTKSALKETYYSAILLSTATSIFITAFIQIIQNLSIQKTLTEDVSSEITKNVSSEINNIRDARNLLTPSNIYWGGEKHFGNDLVSCTRESSTLKFMSISANYLLNERLTNSDICNDRASFRIQLLLLDPTDDTNLCYRSEQMKRHDENKSLEELKKEIIQNIFNAFKLCNKYIRFSFQIRFHRETLLFRMELPNENTLFLSYYDSQKSKDNLGPVARYERTNDVFTSLLNYFDIVWTRYNSSSEISINRETNLTALSNNLISKFPSCKEIIETVFRESEVI